MTASTYDLTIEMGATFKLGVAYKPDEVTPVDLQPYIITAQIRSKNLIDLIAQFTKAAAATTGTNLALETYETVSNALARLTLDDATTKAIQYDEAVWEFKIEDASGEVLRLLTGDVTIVDSHIIEV